MLFRFMQTEKSTFAVDLMRDQAAEANKGFSCLYLFIY